MSEGYLVLAHVVGLFLRLGGLFLRLAGAGGGGAGLAAFLAGRALGAFGRGPFGALALAARPTAAARNSKLSATTRRRLRRPSAVSQLWYWSRPSMKMGLPLVKYSLMTTPRRPT